MSVNNKKNYKQMQKLSSIEITKMVQCFGKIQTATLLLAEKMQQMINLVKSQDGLTIGDVQTLHNLHSRMELNEMFINSKLNELQSILEDDAGVLRVQEKFENWTREFEALVITKIPKDYLMQKN